MNATDDGAKLHAAIRIVVEMADAQDHYASPIYTQHTDAQRQAFAHAARILRLLRHRLSLIAKEPDK